MQETGPFPTPNGRAGPAFRAPEAERPGLPCWPLTRVEPLSLAGCSPVSQRQKVRAT